MMAMLEAILAATINPNLDKQSRIKPRQPSAFMPKGMRRGIKKPTLAQQLELLKRSIGG